MFERYTEKARRVIFFARYEASQFGSASIETEHMLLGLLREDSALADRFCLTAVESIREQIKSHTTLREKVPPSVDLPLSSESKRVLSYAAEESEQMNHKHIGPEHLLIGLLREQKSLAADILHQRGLRLSQVRDEIARPVRISMEVYLSRDICDSDYIDGEVQELNRSELDHGRIQTQFFVYFRNRQEQWRISVNPGLRLQVGPTRIRVVDVCVFLNDSSGGPFLCIEVISPEDRMSRLWDRIDDYLQMGVLHMWVVDPQRKSAFQITSTDGWREVKDGILRTHNPSFEVPLSEIFS